jgi:hypothetical protein
MRQVRVKGKQAPPPFYRKSNLQFRRGGGGGDGNSSVAAAVAQSLAESSDQRENQFRNMEVDLATLASDPHNRRPDGAQRIVNMVERHLGESVNYVPFVDTVAAQAAAAAAQAEQQSAQMQNMRQDALVQPQAASSSSSAPAAVAPLAAALGETRNSQDNVPVAVPSTLKKILKSTPVGQKTVKQTIKEAHTPKPNVDSDAPPKIAGPSRSSSSPPQARPSLVTVGQKTVKQTLQEMRSAAPVVEAKKPRRAPRRNENKATAVPVIALGDREPPPLPPPANPPPKLTRISQKTVKQVIEDMSKKASSDPPPKRTSIGQKTVKQVLQEMQASKRPLDDDVGEAKRKRKEAKNAKPSAKQTRQNNFTKELTADQILDMKLGMLKLQKKVKQKALADGEPTTTKVPTDTVPTTVVAPKMSQSENVVDELIAGASKIKQKLGQPNKKGKTETDWDKLKKDELVAVLMKNGSQATKTALKRRKKVELVQMVMQAVA